RQNSISGRETSMTAADDRWAIVQLLHRYAHAFDSGDFDALSVLFARATLAQNIAAGGSSLTGAAAILGWIKDNVILYDGTPRTMHLVHDPVIDIDEGGNTARSMSYMQLLQQVPPDFPLQNCGTGRYRCKYARDKDGWHFVELSVEGLFSGDISRH